VADIKPRTCLAIMTIMEGMALITTTVYIWTQSRQTAKLIHSTEAPRYEPFESRSRLRKPVSELTLNSRSTRMLFARRSPA
jgi:hypothetical protein